MPNLAVVGAQWGDEGKGKVVDLLSERFDIVARYQGGPNAGHTVTVEGRRHALHHIPSGVFHPSVRIVIGNGMVLDLVKLLEEVEDLERAGVSLAGRLFVSDRAHVILPPFVQLDAGEEEAAGGERIGTTRRGIGPAYEFKAARAGARVADLGDLGGLESRIRRLLEGVVGRRLAELGQPLADPAALAAEAYELGRRIRPYVADTAGLLNDWLDEGKSALFEGAQGTLLDVDHGFYPYVTSSSTIAGGVCAGLGIAPTRIHGAVGVYKAYATRVGAGPMPTELEDGPEGFAEAIRRRGREFGTTTGRPRRCGWFDGVAAAYANRLNRFDAVCVTLLDVLDPFETVNVCTGYRLHGRETGTVPAAAADWAHIEPIYETLPGWQQDTTGARRWEDLPARARAYVERLGELIGAEVALVSVGPDRSQSILKRGSWLAKTLGL